MKRREIVIGSRGSALALWQSRAVAAALEAAHPDLSCRIEVIKTTGDMRREASLVAIAGKGVFTKEIEDAMLDGKVDLAVHSLKDLPTTLPPGLALGAITEREDPRDALVARPGIASLECMTPCGWNAPEPRAATAKIGRNAPNPKRSTTKSERNSAAIVAKTLPGPSHRLPMRSASQPNGGCVAPARN